MPNISTHSELTDYRVKQSASSGPSDWPFVHALTMLLICVLFSTDYLAEYYSWMPRIVTWAPEMVSALLAPFIVGRMAFGTLEIAPKYMLWGLAFIGLLVVSALIHQVQPGAVFYGVRKYARYLPVFLVPILFPEIRERFRHYLWLLLVLTLLQVPMAWWQWATMRIGSSGDAVEGTVTGSGVLTVYLTSSIALLTAFYVKKKIILPTYAVLAVFLTIPTWLNESTATIFLLPVAVAAPIFLAGRLDARKMIAIGLIAWGLLAAFFASYAAQYSDRWGEGGLGYVISGGFIDYLYRGADTSAEDYGHQTEIGRLDSVLLPFLLTDDPVRWLVGVGPGNASTVHNDVFKGEFSETAERYGVDFTTASALVLGNRTARPDLLAGLSVHDFSGQQKGGGRLRGLARGAGVGLGVDLPADRDVLSLPQPGRPHRLQLSDVAVLRPDRGPENPAESGSVCRAHYGRLRAAISACLDGRYTLHREPGKQFPVDGEDTSLHRAGTVLLHGLLHVAGRHALIGGRVVEQL